MDYRVGNTVRFITKIGRDDPKVGKIIFIDTDYSTGERIYNVKSGSNVYTDVNVVELLENKKKENIIEIKEEVSISQEDGSKVILEKGDKIKVLKEISEVLPRDVFNDVFNIIQGIEHRVDKSSHFQAGSELGAIISGSANDDLVNGLYDWLEDFIR